MLEKLAFFKLLWMLRHAEASLESPDPVEAGLWTQANWSGRSGIAVLS